MKIKFLEAAAFLALFICIAACVGFEKDCEDIRQNVLRLHVIADSDSQEAQKLKLQVRDALLLKGEELFSDNDSLDSAQIKLSDNLEQMKKIAEETVKEKGYTYPVEVLLTESYFPTRQYGDITLPAGKYNALKVVIGEGEGQNWWCVMFPPMCLPAASKDEAKLTDVLNEKSMDIVSNEQKYEVRFWIVEKWYELKEWVKGRV